MERVEVRADLSRAIDEALGILVERAVVTREQLAGIDPPPGRTVQEWIGGVEVQDRPLVGHLAVEVG